MKSTSSNAPAPRPRPHPRLHLPVVAVSVALYALAHAAVASPMSPAIGDSPILPHPQMLPEVDDDAEVKQSSDSDGVCPRVVHRDDWGGRPATHFSEMRSPVSTVVIHHTYIPPACTTPAQCVRAMQSMQNAHQLTNGWDDIGYSFVIGGDGRVYKGRGWTRTGAHSPPYNGDSIGISLIGDWRKEAPPQHMLETAKWLISCGVETGRISPDYQLIGHRQARSTDCPGQALFDVISAWPRWTPNPKPPRSSAVQAAADAVDSADVMPAPARSPTPAEQAPAQVPAVALSYDPKTPIPRLDSAVEVRQLNKRHASLWDRLVNIWKQEALRQAAEAQAEGARYLSPSS